jgi:hypothetical protein
MKKLFSLVLVAGCGSVHESTYYPRTPTAGGKLSKIPSYICIQDDGTERTSIIRDSVTKTARTWNESLDELGLRSFVVVGSSAQCSSAPTIGKKGDTGRIDFTFSAHGQISADNPSTYSRFTNKEGLSDYVQIVLNSEYLFLPPERIPTGLREINADNALLHLIGNALGLEDLDNNSSSVMYRGLSVSTISSSDIQTVRWIYSTTFFDFQ